MTKTDTHGSYRRGFNRRSLLYAFGIASQLSASGPGGREQESRGR